MGARTDGSAEIGPVLVGDVCGSGGAAAHYPIEVDMNAQRLRRGVGVLSPTGKFITAGLVEVASRQLIGRDWAVGGRPAPGRADAEVVGDGSGGVDHAAQILNVHLGRAPSVHVG